MTFSLVRMIPGDPIEAMVGERGVSPEFRAQLEKSFGLDLPVHQQYFHYLSNTLQGDLGLSLVSQRPVTEEFFDRFPATLELGLMSLFIAMLIGIPLGIVAAVKRNTVFDYSFMGLSLVGYSMPIFWWGLILILFSSINFLHLPFLGWTPVSGRLSPLFEIPNHTGFLLMDAWFSEEGAEAFWDAVRHLLLPAIAMATIPMATISRMTRSSLLEVLGENYVQTAKAKGLGTFRVIVVHAFRNALIPVVTVIGLSLGSIITGAILTETIFSWPGIARWLVTSVMARDYTVVQGGTLLIAMFIVSINLGIDLLYLGIDPKLRSKSAG
ncbi:MAG: ABC transporter permease subunit [Bdellovibrionales bacterium]|nr:ABC transporter permease subunit [Bdellovibrionales bacterium]